MLILVNEVFKKENVSKGRKIIVEVISTYGDAELRIKQEYLCEGKIWHEESVVSIPKELQVPVFRALSKAIDSFEEANKKIETENKRWEIQRLVAEKRMKSEVEQRKKLFKPGEKSK